MIRKFLLDDSGAATARFTFYASCVLMLIYSFFHTAGAALHDMTNTVTSIMGMAVRRMTGGTLGI